VSWAALGGGIGDFYCWTRPPTLWTWEAGGASGVSSHPAVAAGHVHDELTVARLGAEGSVHRVKLPASGRYEDLGEVAHARRVPRGIAWIEVDR
jgi:hypothetical protein